MTRRRPRLETLVNADLSSTRRMIGSIGSYISRRGTELGIDWVKVRNTAETINTVGAYVAYIAQLREDPLMAHVADVLAYPLPVLSNEELIREYDGRPNWPLMNDLHQHLQYSLGLPLRSNSEMTFEVAQALLSIILSPSYGRRVDLEASATMADAMRFKKNLHSFGQAILFLRALSYVKAIREYPSLA